MKKLESMADQFKSRKKEDEEKKEDLKYYYVLDKVEKINKTGIDRNFSLSPVPSPFNSSRIPSSVSSQRSLHSPISTSINTSDVYYFSVVHSDPLLRIASSSLNNLDKKEIEATNYKEIMEKLYKMKETDNKLNELLILERRIVPKLNLSNISLSSPLFDQSNFELPSGNFEGSKTQRPKSSSVFSLKSSRYKKGPNSYRFSTRPNSASSLLFQENMNVDKLLTSKLNNYLSSTSTPSSKPSFKEKNQINIINSSFQQSESSVFSPKTISMEEKETPYNNFSPTARYNRSNDSKNLVKSRIIQSARTPSSGDKTIKTSSEMYTIRNKLRLIIFCFSRLGFNILLFFYNNILNK
jgi:hypothetical protein